MSELLLSIAIVWCTLLLAAGGAVLLRSKTVLERVIALDLLTLMIIALLALLSYLRDVPYYLDAALALALLAFVSTLAAARYEGEGRLF